MGRSSKTTKGGKFMNPVDQERKLQRKKELKKNKIQRETIRKATLLCQDYKELIQEMESIDKLLFDPIENPDLNENVLRAKRSKMNEKLNKMIEMYEKEDQNMANVLKTAQLHYLRKRAELKNFYEQIKRAENVDINSIMLPSEPCKQSVVIPPLSDIPLPCMPKARVHFSRFSAQELKQLKPAGPPPGPPPAWSDVEDDEAGSRPARKEKVESEPATASDASGERTSDQPKAVQDMSSSDHPLFSPPAIPVPPSGLPPVPHMPNNLSAMPRPPPGPPPMLPTRPVGPPPPIPQRHPAPMYPYPPQGPPPMVAGWPSGYAPSGASNGLPQPPRGPVPPPGLPPSMLANKPPKQSHADSKGVPKVGQSTQSAVISAAPQRRNLKEESTIFMPTALRIKRDQRHHIPAAANSSAAKNNSNNSNANNNNNASTDDVLNAFMEEIKTMM